MEQANEWIAILEAEPEKKRVMREALRRSNNVLPDTLMYAEFCSLPLDTFKRIWQEKYAGGKEAEKIKE
jgi:hypothetical protein